jgi:hypothetical protein
VQAGQADHFKVAGVARPDFVHGRHSRRPVKARDLSSVLSNLTVILRIRELCLSADAWASRRKGRGGAVVLIKWAGDGVEALGDQLPNRRAPEALSSISTTLDRPLELTIVGGLLFSKLLTLYTTHIIYLEHPPAVDVPPVADPPAPACRRGAPTYALRMTTCSMSEYCARKSAIPSFKSTKPASGSWVVVL